MNHLGVEEDNLGSFLFGVWHFFVISYWLGLLGALTRFLGSFQVHFLLIITTAKMSQFYACTIQSVRQFIILARPNDFLPKCKVYGLNSEETRC